MYVVYLAGGIASGKSTAAQKLARLGAARIDLDALSREALAPGSPAVRSIGREFGDDLVDNAGAIDRHELARRAFVDADSTRLLERLELPEIGRLLKEHLEELSATGSAACCVVEVPLLDRVEAEPSLMSLSDEVVAVCCPFGQRRVRAIGRGMDAADFERRACQQPSEEYLRAHADTVWNNADGAPSLASQIEAWWDERSASGWAYERGARHAEA